jgi:L-malate glycosyltransferase
MKKKITHLLYSGLGGHANVFFSFVNASDERILNAAIFYGIEEIKNEYVEKCIKNNIPFKFAPKKAGLDFKFYLQVFSSLIKSNPDIIFLHGSTLILPAFLYKIIYRKKMITRETQANHLKSFSNWVFLLLAIVLSNKVIFLSKEYRNEVEKKFSFIPLKNKTAIIPNGINLTEYSGREINDDIIRIGMQSRIVDIKDHKTLILAISALKDQPYFHKLELHIAGEGPCLNNLIQLTLDIGIEQKVKFHGMLDQKNLIAFMKHLNIYVHATLGETMSTSIMQAQACGLAIIASDVPGVNNMIENYKNGILVMPENPKELSLAINKLIINPDLVANFEKASLDYAQKNLSHTLMFSKYLELFSSF